MQPKLAGLDSDRQEALKEITFDGSGFSVRRNRNFCVRGTPQGASIRVRERGRERQRRTDRQKETERERERNTHRVMLSNVMFYAQSTNTVI